MGAMFVRLRTARCLLLGAALPFTLLSCSEGAGIDAGLGSGGSASGGVASASGGLVGSGGASTSGGAGPSASGGAVAGTGGATGGAPFGVGGGSGGAGAGGASGGQVGSGGAPAALGPYLPAKGSTGQCPDPSIRLRFDAAPTLGSSGSVRVYDAANAASPVAEVNLAQAQITDTIGGSVFTLPRPAFVDGGEAIFVLPSAGLEYGHTYYVTIDEGVVTGPDGEDMAISDPNDWRFTVAAAPPATAENLRVALDGTGQFCSIQGAIDASETGTSVEIEPGAYYGVVYFTEKDGLSLIGADRETTRILGINNNNLNPSTRGRALFGSEDLTDLLVESITIHNLTPQDGSQAEALALLSCDQCIVRDSTIRSLQDTLLWSGRIYAEDSLVEGNVDYIWGSGTAYFNRVEIKTVGRKGYNIQARNGDSNYGYVFVDSKLTSDPGITGDVLARIDVSQYPYSHVAYIDCEMGPHIAAAGWTITGSGSLSGLRFWEYQSRTPDGELVDTGGRADGSKQLTQPEAEQMRDAGVVLGGWDPR